MSPYAPWTLGERDKAYIRVRCPQLTRTPLCPLFSFSFEDTNIVYLPLKGGGAACPVVTPVLRDPGLSWARWCRRLSVIPGLRFGPRARTSLSGPSFFTCQMRMVLLPLSLTCHNLFFSLFLLHKGLEKNFFEVVSMGHCIRLVFHLPVK